MLSLDGEQKPGTDGMYSVYSEGELSSMTRLKSLIYAGLGDAAAPFFPLRWNQNALVVSLSSRGQTSDQIAYTSYRYRV